MLAEARRTNYPLNSFFIVPMKRILNFWLNFNAGYGWPGFGSQLSNQDRLDLASANVIGKLRYASDYPIVIVGRIFTQIWKILLYLGFGLTLCLTLSNLVTRSKSLIVFALSFIAVRSYMAGYMNIMEARYSVMNMPILEVVVILVLIEALSNWRKN